MLIWREIGQGGVTEYEVFTVREYLYFTNVEPRQVRRQIDEGKLIAIKPGRDWFVLRNLSEKRPLAGRQHDRDCD